MRDLGSFYKENRISQTIRALQILSRDLVVLNLPREFDEVLPAARKAPYAVFTLAVVVTLMATGWVPNVQAALIGCLLMGLFRCINLDQAYRSIQWKGLIMIVGMLPFALDEQTARQSIKQMLDAAQYIKKATGYQNSSNEKLSTAINVTTQVSEQLSSGATSAIEASNQLKDVVNDLRRLVGR